MHCCNAFELPMIIIQILQKLGIFWKQDISGLWDGVYRIVYCVQSLLFLLCNTNFVTTAGFRALMLVFIDGGGVRKKCAIGFNS